MLRVKFIDGERPIALPHALGALEDEVRQQISGCQLDTATVQPFENCLRIVAALKLDRDDFRLSPFGRLASFVI